MPFVLKSKRHFTERILLVCKTTRIGFEPTTSAVTGRRSNQLSHRAVESIDIPSKPHIHFTSSSSLMRLAFLVGSCHSLRARSLFCFDGRLPCPRAARSSLPPRRFHVSGQALDRLVAVSSTHCCASTSALSTSSSSRGLTPFGWDISS